MIDWTKPIRSRTEPDRVYKFICDDMGGPFPVLLRWKYVRSWPGDKPDDQWYTAMCTNDGRLPQFAEPTIENIFEPPVTIKEKQMIDTTRKLQTRSGLPVRIYATNGGGDYPLHGAVYNDGEWYDYHWRADGRFLSERKEYDMSLVYAPVTIKGFVNVHMRAGDGYAVRGPVHDSYDNAVLNMIIGGYIATVPIEFEVPGGEE